MNIFHSWLTFFPLLNKPFDIPQDRKYIQRYISHVIKYLELIICRIQKMSMEKFFIKNQSLENFDSLILAAQKTKPEHVGKRNTKFA